MKTKHVILFAGAIFLGLAGYVGAQQSGIVPPLRIYNQGSLVPLPLRYKLNHTGGGINCVDNASTETTVCTSSGGGGGGSIGGTATSGEVSYGTGSNAIGSSSAFVFAPGGGLGLTGSSNLLYGDSSTGIEIDDSLSDNSRIRVLSAQITARTGGDIALTTGFGSANTVFDLTSDGAISLPSSSAAAVAGGLRWNGTNVQISNNGSTWISIPTSGGGGGTFATTYDNSTPANNLVTEVRGGGPLTLLYAAIGTAQTSGLTVENTSAATNSVEQFSPALTFSGSSWGTTGGAAQTVTEAIQGRSTQSTVGVGELSFLAANGGGSLVDMMHLTHKHPQFGLVAGPVIRMVESGSSYLYSDNEFYFSAGGANGFALNSVSIIADVSMRPDGDNILSSGTSTFHWNYVASNQYETKLGTQLTAASTITPVSGLHHITGATTITTIAATNFTGNATLTLIADSATITISTGGNVAFAITISQNNAQQFIYDATGATWYPVK